jgi:hypothetical protein
MELRTAIFSNFAHQTAHKLPTGHSKAAFMFSKKGLRQSRSDCPMACGVNVPNGAFSKQVPLERNEKEIIDAARRGADTERPMEGEDPTIYSPEVSRRWQSAYSELLELETGLLHFLSEHMPRMSADAQREAQLTNLPLIESQVERFRQRLELWRQRAKGREAPLDRN